MQSLDTKKLRSFIGSVETLLNILPEYEKAKASLDKAPRDSDPHSKRLYAEAHQAAHGLCVQHDRLIESLGKTIKELGAEIPDWTAAAQLHSALLNYR